MKTRINVEIEIIPFDVPEFVLQVGVERRDAPIRIRDLDEATLSALCDGFREEVFMKAGKKDPRLA